MNAAGDKAPAAVSPGSLVSVFGRGLAEATAVASPGADGLMPLTLAGTEVEIGGKPSALLYASPTQINLQAPQDISPGRQTLAIRTASGRSFSTSIEVYAASPGIFTVVRNADGSVVSARNAAQRGDVLVVYCTGLGLTTGALATGQPAPSNSFAVPRVAPEIRVAGLPMPAANDVASPGFVGLFQVGFVLPTDTPGGPAPLVLSSGGNSSNSWPLAIEGSGDNTRFPATGSVSGGCRGWVLMGRGDGNMDDIEAGSTGCIVNQRLIADVNGDRRDDLVIDGQIYLSLPSGLLESERLGVRLATATELFAFDANQDGKVDLVYQTPTEIRTLLQY